MSYDLFVHTRQQGPIEIERLTARMRALGWETRVLLDDYPTATVVSAGPVPEDGLVYGWDPTSPDAERCAALFPAGGTVALNQLPDDLLSFDGSGLSYAVPTPPEEELSPEDWASLTQGLPPEKIDLLRTAALRYYLRTNAHVNLFRFIFQSDLALAVAQECRGLLEDPQDGKYRWAHEVPPDAQTPIARALKQYNLMFPKPWWRKALDHLLGEEDGLRPDGVNNLIWLAGLESGLRLFRLGLGLRFQQYFSPTMLLTALLFAAIGFGLYRGRRWAWVTMLIAFPLAVGADVLLSLPDGFGLGDGLRLAMLALALAYLLSGPVREHFGV